MTNCLIGLILEAREIVLGNPMEYLPRRGSFDEDLITEDDKRQIDVPFFSLNSILVATDNFSNATKLGRGGFGPVYKVFGYFLLPFFCSVSCFTIWIHLFSLYNNLVKHCTCRVSFLKVQTWQ